MWHSKSQHAYTIKAGAEHSKLSPATQAMDLPVGLSYWNFLCSCASGYLGHSYSGDRLWVPSSMRGIFTATPPLCCYTPARKPLTTWMVILEVTLRNRCMRK